MSNEAQNRTWTVDTETRIRSIDDVELTELRLKPILKFLIAFGVGGFFFLLPITWHGQITVPFDIAVSIIIDTFPDAVGVYALGIIIAGGLLTTVAEFNQRDIISVGWDVSYFESSSVFWALRVIGVVLAPIMFFKLGPGWLHTGNTGGFIWDTLIYSVAVIIPIGAIFVTIFVELGGLEFIGTLSRPFMRPLFKVPGRAALDSLASWVGSYSVGLYVTRNVFERGAYHKRDATIIATCFSTVSVGFVGVIAATLGLLSLFPVIFLAYFICIVICTVIMVRLPPISSTSPEYIAEPDPEVGFEGSTIEYLKFALSEAVAKAEEGETFREAATRGFSDGLKLASLILGTILTVGLAAVLLSAYTPTFEILGAPLVPIIELLGIPNAEQVAPATIVGITEMYVPIILVQGTAPMAKFFIAVLAPSQLIFFSSVGPMIMDMFDDIPIRFRDLVVMFVMRTVILVPIVAVMTHIVNALGLL